MTTMHKNAALLMFGGVVIAQFVALYYVVAENHWAMTHRAQVEAVRADYEGHVKDWTLGKE